MKNDYLQSFLLEQRNVRGEIVHLGKTFQTALERHAYPEIIGKMLGETLTAVSLLAGTLKLEGNIILQVQPQNSAVKLLVAQIDQQFHVRGLAQWDNTALPTAFDNPFLNGHLAITITPQFGQRYQGIVNLDGSNLSNAIENYFKQSEQLPTCLFLCAEKNQTAGFLLQQIPDAANTDQQAWNDLVHITQSLTPKELFTLSNEEILHRLFHQEDVRLFETKPIIFHCDCTIQRMENAVRVLGKQEALALLQTHKTVSVTCEFCNNRYDFSRSDIDQIFAQK